MRLRASVIIPTHNRAATIALSLPHLYQQRIARDCYEVIVIDDGSTDETENAVERASEGRAAYRRLQQGGASVARNKALAIARGEVIVFLDDDCFVGPDFLARHLAIHQRKQNALVAGGIRDVASVPTSADLEQVTSIRTYHRHPMPCGNASVRRAHIAAVGGFDESFNSYGWQDQELAERLLQNGLVRSFAWGATILHYRPHRVVFDAAHELQRELQRGRMGARFYRKHPKVTVGITTKLWPPIRGVERLLDRFLNLESTSQRILDGERVVSEFRGVRASLLRAHVEINAGRQELRRLDQCEMLLARARVAPLDECVELAGAGAKADASSDSKNG